MGLRPVAEMQFMDFASCAFDMITNFAAKSRYRCGLGVPLVVRGPCGAGVGGGPFHSVNPEAHYPEHAWPQDRRTVDRGRRQGAARIRHPRRGPRHRPRAQVPLPANSRRGPGRRASRADREGGRAAGGPRRHRRDLWRDGPYGARSGRRAGRNRASMSRCSTCERSRRSIATRSSRRLARTSRALVLYEATRTGGIGGEIAAILAEEAFEYLDAPIVRLASLDTPVPYSPPLEQAYLPTRDKVVEAVKRLVEILGTRRG